MKRLPPLRLLTVFEAVARSGSMRTAAGELNVSQAAVSQAMRSLEEHIRSPLIDRTTRPATLTDAGRRLAAATRDGLALVSTAIEAIQTDAQAEDRTLTVACTVGMATHWLMPRLSHFYAEHADTLVNVQANPTDLVRPQPGVDVTLSYGLPRPGDGRSLRLFEERVCPVGRTDLIDRLTQGGGGLQEAPLIHVAVEPEGNWATWSDYCRARGEPAPRTAGTRFNTYVQAVQAALDGRGLMLGWRSITDALIDDGKLKKWPVGEISLGTSYFVTVAERAEKKQVCVAFVDWIVGESRIYDEPAPPAASEHG